MSSVHGVNCYKQYETDDNRNIRIKILESSINKVFHYNYRIGLVLRMKYYEEAFTETALIGQ
jgi:hypothetical protein